MIFVGTEAAHRQRRRQLRLPNGTDYFKGEYLQAPEDPKFSPQAFLIEQPPNSTILSHFHRQNQFQVVIGGSGTIGRHDLRPVTVHYAGAYTGYGPLISGPEGLTYFTLRFVSESGANFLPEARADMLRGPKRHFTSSPLQCLNEEQLKSLAAPRIEQVLPREDDALAVLKYSLPPGGRLTSLDPAGSAGQFLIVANGALEHAGALLRRWENLFVSADEAGYVLSAGPAGAEVLLLQYPPKAQTYDAMQ
jgi:hypothetical protein